MTVMSGRCAEWNITVHKTDITIHKTDITAHKTDITVHKKDITVPKIDITVHKTDITVHKTDITVHKTRVAVHLCNWHVAMDWQIVAQCASWHYYMRIKNQSTVKITAYHNDIFHGFYRSQKMVGKGQVYISSSLVQIRQIHTHFVVTTTKQNK